MPDIAVGNRKEARRNRTRTSGYLWGWLFSLPACVGLLIYIVLPMIYSFVISFYEWDIITPPRFVGFNNYSHLFTADGQFWNSLWVTTKYTLFYVPGMLAVTFVLAALINMRGVRAKSLWRISVYVPSVVPMVAASVLWMFIYDPLNGMLNSAVKPFGLYYEWIFDKSMVLQCFAVMGIWSAGNTIMVNLSGLGSIPQDLYEAVDIDGGGAWSRMWNVTLPMMTPIVFYNLVMAIIAAIQTFTQGYMMTKGGPDNASNFYMLHLYRNAFSFNRMGLACAQSWLLFALVGLLTLLLFRTSGWVYYGGDSK